VVGGVRGFKTVRFGVGSESKKYCKFYILEFLFQIMPLRDDDEHNIPELIYDVGTNVTYRKGRFLGKVSLSLCFILAAMYRFYFT
jgi:hypothetical protein